MNSVLEYMARKHVTLRHEYRAPNGVYNESCGVIAAEIANLLIKNNHDLSIVIITPLYGKLCPQIFETVGWDNHMVCTLNDLVFDPVFEKPSKKQFYLDMMFQEKVRFETFKEGKVNVQNFINKLIN